jgi:hypothetical protein
MPPISAVTHGCALCFLDLLSGTWVYPLPERVEVERFGRQGLPEGIALVGGRVGDEMLEELAAEGARRRTAGRPPRMGVA